MEREIYPTYMYVVSHTSRGVDRVSVRVHTTPRTSFQRISDCFLLTCPSWEASYSSSAALISCILRLRYSGRSSLSIFLAAHSLESTANTSCHITSRYDVGRSANVIIVIDVFSLVRGENISLDLLRSRK